MTRDQHRTEAERLLALGTAKADELTREIESHGVEVAIAAARFANIQAILQAAQVHATLAIGLDPASE